MKTRIVVVGSSNTDMIIRLNRLPRPGETLLGGEFSMAAGGKGANQAVAAARAGARVTFIARVGKDIFGERALEGFRRDGIAVDRIIRDPRSASGVALIFVGAEGQNSIAVASGANARLTASDVRRARGVIAEADLVVMQLETPLATVRAAAQEAAAAGVPVVLNPAPARPLPRTLLRLVTVLTPNETEAEMLSGVRIRNDRSAVRAAVALLGHGPKIVAITLGARGALVATQEGHQIVPAFPVRAVDTTAAGDVFNGALAVALAEEKPLIEAVRFANAAAALSVTRLGAQPSAPRRSTIERLLCG
ncbi:MAG TPA: ribokinase [Candidatus Paceibacterota bacterium]|nr:ribokinase [Candidatus Paceibacterota bacterium]